MSNGEEPRNERRTEPAQHAHEVETVFHPTDADSGPKPANAGADITPGVVATLDEFSRALIEIGLIEAAELDGFGVAAAEGVLGLSRALVKAAKLTPYQAAAVYQKKSRGLLIANYLILDKLGQGGMGVVFKARHRRLGRIGALKILPPSFARDRDAVLRFRREVEAAGRLKHPNLVAAQDADEDRGVHFLVMEFVEGRDLDHFVRERGPMPITQAIDCLMQAARGLEAAHVQGIIHRDIKPGNLMLDSAGTVRVLDLGLARIVDASNPFSKSVAGRLTQSGMYMGTIDYMAPEQAEDSHRVDHRADIYSLGCTLYYLLTGREPFPAESVLKRLLAHMERPAPSLVAARPGVAQALEAAYQKMMAKLPQDRPASMAEVVALLETCKTEALEAPKSQTELKVFNEPTLKRARAPKTKVERSVIGLSEPSEADDIAHELDLEDLAMDVRAEVPSRTAPITLARSQPSLRAAGSQPKRPVLLRLALGAALLLGALVAGLMVFRQTETNDVPRPVIVDKSVGAGRNRLDGALDDSSPSSNREAIVDAKADRGRDTAIMLRMANGDFPTVDAKTDRGRASGDSSLIPNKTGAPDKRATEAPADSSADPTVSSLTNSIGMTLKLIPSGHFLMGSPETDPDALPEEKPAHMVEISAFYLGATEVTRGQFRRFISRTGYKTDAEKLGKGGLVWNDDRRDWKLDPKATWQSPGFEQTDHHPVVEVSWNDAVAFCAWLSREECRTYRLPTEAEWEYACRAGTTTKYFSGDDPETLVKVGNVADATARAKHPRWDWTIAGRDGYVYTAPVGSFQPNAFGLHDTHGNVWEWCWDWYDEDSYKRPSAGDPSGGAKAGLHVQRGGSWEDAPRYYRSATRSRHGPQERFGHVGFRVARTEPVGLAMKTASASVNSPGGSQPPADARPGDSVTNSIGMTFKLILPGEFFMGAPDDDKDAQGDQKPRHRVRITKPFYLGIHEVTQGQFGRFVDETGYLTDPERHGKPREAFNSKTKKTVLIPHETWRKPGFTSTNEMPVVAVSWNDAVAFAQWLSKKEGKTYRLPTEAEWEYACRAGTTTRFSSGDDFRGVVAAGNLADGTLKQTYPGWVPAIAFRDGFVWTAPGGRFKPNAWGLHDMHGNVSEFCADVYEADYYRVSPVDDPRGPDPASAHLDRSGRVAPPHVRPVAPADLNRVARGGSWDSDPRQVASAHRVSVAPHDGRSGRGFRLALDEAVSVETLAEAYERSYAARAAALAGCGLKRSNPPLDSAAQTKLRTRALDWLRTELGRLAKVHESNPTENQANFICALEYWKSTPDLAGVRDADALGKLPAEEQKPWRTLWLKVEALLQADDPWKHTRLGEALSAEGRRDEAAAEFREAVRLAPNDGANCHNMALVMRGQGHTDPAIELFERAARWDREHIDDAGVGMAIWALGDTLRSLARYDEAVASFRRVREFPHAGPDDLRKAESEIAQTEAQRRSQAVH